MFETVSVMNSDIFTETNLSWVIDFDEIKKHYSFVLMIFKSARFEVLTVLTMKIAVF
jgi:hypothetical protein